MKDCGDDNSLAFVLKKILVRVQKMDVTNDYDYFFLCCFRMRADVGVVGAVLAEVF